MKQVKLFLSIPLITGILYACSMTPQDSYSRHVLDTRLAKDSFFKWSEQSPMDEPHRKDFAELHYFAPDSNYRVTAHIEKIMHPDTIKIEDTRGDNMEAIRYAKLYFKIGKTPCTLIAYKQIKTLTNSPNPDMIFIPFYDESNGKTTHSGGRYLDMEYKGESPIVLDFNYAYNPYCAYSPEYSCPIPPAENRLTIAINAGEKEFGQ